MNRFTTIAAVLAVLSGMLFGCSRRATQTEALPSYPVLGEWQNMIITPDALCARYWVAQPNAEAHGRAVARTAQPLVDSLDGGEK